VLQFTPADRQRVAGPRHPALDQRGRGASTGEARRARWRAR